MSENRGILVLNRLPENQPISASRRVTWLKIAEPIGALLLMIFTCLLTKQLSSLCQSDKCLHLISYPAIFFSLLLLPRARLAYSELPPPPRETPTYLYRRWLVDVSALRYRASDESGLIYGGTHAQSPDDLLIMALIGRRYCMWR